MFDCIKNLIYSFDSFYKIEKEQDLIILTPKDQNIPITSSLIFMHGLGDTADGYLQTFQSSSRPVPDNARVILPTAPLASVDIAGGEQMRSWYNIRGFNSEEDISEEDINKSSERIAKLIHKEAEKFDGHYEKVYVGGFSQGACIALNIGLNFEKELGGIVALSGILFPFCTKNVNVKSKKDMAIYIGHGEKDDMINIKLAKVSYKYFEENNFTNVKFREFSIGHSINGTELEEVKDFIYMNTIKFYV